MYIGCLLVTTIRDFLRAVSVEREEGRPCLSWHLTALLNSRDTCVCVLHIHVYRYTSKLLTHSLICYSQDSEHCSLYEERESKNECICTILHTLHFCCCCLLMFYFLYYQKLNGFASNYFKKNGVVWTKSWSSKNSPPKWPSLTLKEVWEFSVKLNPGQCRRNMIFFLRSTVWQTWV